jgi:hypothetical protein
MLPSSFGPSITFTSAAIACACSADMPICSRLR